MEADSLFQYQSQPSFPEGVIVKDLKLNKIDKELSKGYSAELFRVDWKDIVKDEIKQVYYSTTVPGSINAWHRHLRGQVDYMVVISGKVEVLIREESGKIHKILVNGGEPKLIRIPGHYWHGWRNVGKNPAFVVYFLSELYDYENPDEERMPYEGGIENK